MREDLVVRLLRWAEAYYPERKLGLPPWRDLGLGRDELCALFSRVGTMRGHLALVDQPYVRAWLKDPAVLTAAWHGWTVKGGYARPLGAMLRKTAEKAPPAAQTALPL